MNQETKYSEFHSHTRFVLTLRQGHHFLALGGVAAGHSHRFYRATEVIGSFAPLENCFALHAMRAHLQSRCTLRRLSLPLFAAANPTSRASPRSG